MSVTFFASGASDAVDSPTLILTNNQARNFLHWLGLPSRELCGSMWAADLAERIRRVLHPEVVDVGDEGEPPVKLNPSERRLRLLRRPTARSASGMGSSTAADHREGRPWGCGVDVT